MALPVDTYMRLKEGYRLKSRVESATPGKAFKTVNKDSVPREGEINWDKLEQLGYENTPRTMFGPSM